MEENKEITMSFGNLYEANQNLMKNDIKLPKEKIENCKKDILTYLNLARNHYYMCLCKELSDYTIFKINKLNYEKLVETIDILIDECMTNRGDILHIQLTEAKDAVEIWVRVDEEIKCYYFFGYDAAIIEVE